MLIGARTAAWQSAGGWTNPYVTDGLVAMWDGEWNAGVGGEHSSITTVWKDIVGGLEFEVRGTGVSFEDNYIDITGDTAYLHRDIAINDDIYNIFYGESVNFTVEHIAYCNELRNFARFFTIFGTVNSYGYGATAYSAESRLLRYAYIKNALLTLSYNVNSVSMSIVSSGTASNFYVNGLLNKTGTHSATVLNYREWNIGGGVASNKYWNGRVYSHRLYNRALTDAEIAANYAIDKARFGIS